MENFDKDIYGSPWHISVYKADAANQISLTDITRSMRRKRKVIREAVNCGIIKEIQDICEEELKWEELLDSFVAFFARFHFLS